MTVPVCLTLFLPLLGSALLAVFGRLLPRRLSGALACLSIAGSLAGAVWAWAALAASGEPKAVLHLADWFSAGGLTVSASVLLNPLSVMMAVMVSFVSLIIHIHSVWFMREDNGFVRYFCYLNLFVFFMQSIVLAEDLVFLFLGWEGVGFCSFSLIGFWFTDPDKVLAGRKAFLVTRIGDVAFLAAIALLFRETGGLGLEHVAAVAPHLAPSLVTLLGLLFLWAAAGKSAQLPLLVWLPDAMAGPSPVSALIHAATMVTAGVYLLIRVFPLLSLSPVAMGAVAAVGAFTAFMAACSALAQHDIKRVLAWSTISQVGYMVLGIGAGDPGGSFFHLLVHAFFKSLLFMVAGIVIQALHEEHDIFRMGARVRRVVPGAALAFFCGAAALAGLPPFAGFFSKGRVLESALALAETQHGFWMLIWAVGTATALLTAIYSFRVFLLAFTGKPELVPQTGTEKTPGPMLHVLWPLALLAVAAGLLNLPEHAAHIMGAPAGWLDGLLHAVPGMGHAPAHEANVERTAEFIDAGLAVLGLLLALALYGPWRAHRHPAEHRGLPAVLEDGFWLDRLYMTAVARPYRAAADVVWRRADDGTMDAAALGLGRTALRAGGRMRRWTSGRLSNYLLWLLVGVVTIIVFLAAVGAR